MERRMNILVRYGFSQLNVFDGHIHDSLFIAAMPADFYGCLDAPDHIPAGSMVANKYGPRQQVEMRQGWV